MLTVILFNLKHEKINLNGDFKSLLLSLMKKISLLNWY